MDNYEKICDELTFIKDAMQDGFISVDNRLNSLEAESIVEITNGGVHKEKVSKLVALQHDKINEIFEAVEIFIDLSKVHRIFKKWKIYWIILILLPGYGIGYLVSKLLLS